MVSRYNLKVSCAGEGRYSVKIASIDGKVIGGFSSFIQRSLRGGDVDEVMDQLEKVVCEFYDFALVFEKGAKESLGSENIEKLEKILGELITPPS